VRQLLLAVGSEGETDGLRWLSGDGWLDTGGGVGAGDRRLAVWACWLARA